MAPPKASYAVNSLKRWSVKNPDPFPAIENIKSLHIYDFDNTVFSSPLPNPQVWSGPTVGQLQSIDVFAQGGWWHDASILEATGEGIDKEESRGWAGSWNEPVVDLVKLSMQQKDVLTVLLTGRAETAFSELIQRIVKSRQLEFDLIVLKPEVSPSGLRFNSTMDFKQAFLREMIYTFKHSEDIRVYEDRQGHVKGFREYFERLNKSLLSHHVDEPAPPRKPFHAEIVHVCELRASLNIQTEIEVVQRMINRHNHAILTGGPNPRHAKNRTLQIRENFSYCGYLINQNDSARLIQLTNCAAHLIDSGEIKLMATNILISPSPPSQDILQKVGGKGKKVTWQVTGLAKFEDRIWAARVSPLSDGERIVTKDHTPLVVLALRKGTRSIDAGRINNWNNVPADKQYIFETVVGDKVMLSIEEMADGGDGIRGGRGGFPSSVRGGRYGGQKRKFANANAGEEDFLGKENFPALGEKSNGERDDGSWVPVRGGSNNRHSNNNQGQGQGQGGGSDRHGQARYFNQAKQQPGHPNEGGRNFSGGGTRGGRSGGGRRNDSQNFDNSGKQGKSQGQRQSGGGGRGGRGGNRAPPGYKSLDDYGPGNFDGPGDVKTGGGGQMVMDY